MWKRGEEMEEIKKLIYLIEAQNWRRGVILWCEVSSVCKAEPK